MNDKVQGEGGCWCVEPGVDERVEERVKRGEEAIEPDCVTG